VSLGVTRSRPLLCFIIYIFFASLLSELRRCNSWNHQTINLVALTHPHVPNLVVTLYLPIPQHYYYSTTSRPLCRSVRLRLLVLGKVSVVSWLSLLKAFRVFLSSDFNLSTSLWNRGLVKIYEYRRRWETKLLL
jgi:hypothetical protein